jgi:hypothetical protein
MDDIKERKREGKKGREKSFLSYAARKAEIEISKWGAGLFFLWPLLISLVFLYVCLCSR